MRFFILIMFSFLSLTVFATEAVHEYQLPNGLKVIVKEDHRVPVVVSQLWYKVGASYEPNGLTGISHLLEHIMFRGTQKFGPGVFSKIIAENGGEDNAFTSFDFTSYYQVFEADKLPISLQLESDRMRNLLLRPGDFAKELEIVKEERRLRTEDNPQQLVYERFAAIAHMATPYRHPVIGWMSDLDHFKLDDLRQWYNTWYAPNNAVLVVVGDVNPTKVNELALQYFGQIKPSKINPVKQESEIPNPGLRRISVKVPAKLPWLVMGYNVPVLKTAADPKEAYALDVLQGILSSGDSARLPKEIIRSKQLATSASAGYDLYSRLDDLFTLNGIPAPGHNVQELEQAFLSQIKRLQTELVSQQELDRVKAQVIAAKVYEKDSIQNQAEEIGTLESVDLSWKEADLYVKHIQEVTPQEIQNVAKKYLIPERLAVGVLDPLPVDKNHRQNTLENLEGQHVR